MHRFNRFFIAILPTRISILLKFLHHATGQALMLRQRKARYTTGIDCD